MRALRRWLSAPPVPSVGMGASAETVMLSSDSDVFVGSRPFRESGCGGPIAKRTPLAVKEFARSCGVCHYLLVFRSSDGVMVEFDFGPAGGDIFINPLALKWPRLKSTRNPHCVAGEIRERHITELPDDFVHVGSTHLELEDVRQFNSEQSTEYELHVNDCRHYVNRLTFYATGMECASSFYVRTRLNLMRKELPLWNLYLIRICKVVSDVTQWPRVRAAGNASAAAVCAIMGPPLARRASLVASSAVRRQLAGSGVPERAVARPVRRAAVAAIAAVAATCEEVPVLKGLLEVTGTINERTRSLILSAGAAFASATQSVSHFRVSPARAIAARSAMQPFPVYAGSIVRQVSGRSLSFLSMGLFQAFHNRAANPLDTTHGPRLPRPLGSRGRRYQLSVPLSL